MGRRSRKNSRKNSKTRRRARGGAANEFPNRAEVTFAGIRAQEGQEFSQAETAEEPRITYSPIPTNRTATLVVYDPDAPAGTWLHWLKTDSKTLVPWAPPTPPTGTHRYFFAIYTSPEPLKFIPRARPNFNLQEFVAKNSLAPHALAMIRVSAGK